MIRVSAIDNVLSDPLFQWAGQRLESRFNDCHDDLGRFCSGGGSGRGAIGSNLSSTLDARAVKSITTARDALLEKYPDAKMGTIDMADDRIGSGAAAQTRYRLVASSHAAAHPAEDPTIVFDPHTADYAATVKDYRDSIGYMYHPDAGPDNDAYAAITTHEFAHVLDANGGEAAQHQAEKVLRAEWERHNATATEDNVYYGFENFVHDNISGYALDRAGNLNPQEALAEAFQDVEMNGADASPASHALHKLLVDSYRNAP